MNEKGWGERSGREENISKDFDVRLLGLSLREKMCRGEIYKFPKLCVRRYLFSVTYLKKDLFTQFNQLFTHVPIRLFLLRFYNLLL